MTIETHSSSEAGVIPADGYAGDVSPTTAWTWVKNGKATLVDVRSSAELAWVGYVPQGVAIPWKEWPGMTANTQFDDQLQSAVTDADRPVVFLCRSGKRSVAAARRATDLGYRAAYNILEGFEGDRDAQGHRGGTGWRAAGLPWQQD